MQEYIADYIVFIENEKLLLADTKDEMLESYLLIKGDTAKLTANDRTDYGVSHWREKDGCIV